MGAEAALKASSHRTSTQARRPARLLVIVLSGLLLLGAMIIALGQGSQDIPSDQVINALLGGEDVKKSVSVIVNQVRLPRALIGALVGLNLAVAGTMLQGAVRSPLADPYILGISAGGGLTAAALTLQGPDVPRNLIPVAALAGSLVGALIVYAAAWDGTGITATRLVLAGVAITAMFGAMTTTVVVLSVEGGGQIIFQWLVGGLYTVGWTEYHLIAPYSAAGFVLAMLLATRANVLALGDDVAQGLGLRVEQTRFAMSAVAALLAGSSVAVAGLIGFVGLLVPFVARRLVGSDHRYLIPTSALLGAALMVGADTLARVTLPQWFGAQNTEFPVGIVTAIIGGPLFLWLVRARRSQW